MSNSKADNTIDELDLSDIFSLFKRWVYKVLAVFFKAIDFMFKFWWVTLILIIVGVALGKFMESPIKYKASMIVKINFYSQSYVYNTLEQMIGKISDGDTSFISENKLGDKDNLILDAEINPIIDVVSFLKKVKEVDEKNLGEVLKKLTPEDEGALFASEQFHTSYRYHKLELSMKGNDKTFVENTFNYINNQPSILEIKDGYIINQKDRIESNDRTIAQIGAMMDDYTNNVNVASKNAEKLSYFNNEYDLPLDGVLLLKNTLVIDTEWLKNDHVTATDAIVALGDIQLVEDTDFMDKKHIYYPTILVFLFFLITGIRYSYKSLRRRLIAENFLD